MARRIGFGEGDKSVAAAEAAKRAEREARAAAARARAAAAPDAAGETGLWGASDLSPAPEPEAAESAPARGDRPPSQQRKRNTGFGRSLAWIFAIIVLIGGINGAGGLEGLLRALAGGNAGPLFGAVAPALLVLVFGRWITQSRPRRTEASNAAPPDAATRGADAPPRTRRERRAAEQAAAARAARSEGVESQGGLGRWIGAVFLTVWLIGWTFGMVMAAGVILRGEGPALFLFVWLAAAAVGWVIAARQLWRLVTGRDVSNVPSAARRRNSSRVPRTR